jgi:hypothetical protein
MDCRCLHINLSKKFRSVERLYTIEFDRLEFRNHSSWESKLTGNGLHLNLGPTAKPNNIGILKYQFEKLDFFKSFSETDIV